METLALASRIPIANKILATFVRNFEFTLVDGRLHIHRTDIGRSTPASLYADGRGFVARRNFYPGGGTSQAAACQVLLWVRDEPRMPMDTWNYWCGPKIKLGNSETLRLLRSTDYANPEKTKCIFCGTQQFRGGLDWWALDGKRGPCCATNHCVNKPGLAMSKEGMLR